MPAILTETAYINHTQEEQLLNTPEFRQMAADAIVLGVADYARLNLRGIVGTPERKS
jgi:N-acetylmuramoyl-L-alanine amidase